MSESTHMAPPEKMTVAEARAELGVSNKTIARLLKEGALTATPDPLDRRIKLVLRADVLALKAQSMRPKESAA